VFRSPPRALIALLWPLLSTACAEGPPVLLDRTVPASLLTCQPQPDPPAGPDDTALALWLVDLAAAGEDCRARLGSVKELLDAKP
jgi:hypothetical protein